MTMASIYRLTYSLLWLGLSPIALLRLFWRSRKKPGMRQDWQQRLGFIPVQTQPLIWLHAVSVGETVAAQPLVEQLLQRYPQHRLLISNTTFTGRQTAQRLFGERVKTVYCPYDFPLFIRLFNRRAKPELLIIMETEIWPNLLHHCGQQNIPVVLANARLSERSCRGYTRIKPLISAALANIDLIACRSQTDVDNFIRIGADPARLKAFGNIKFDITPTPSQSSTSTIRYQLGPTRSVFVAASTHKGEDEHILALFSRLKSTFPDLVLILVPRHPERFTQVFKLCEQTNLNIQRRSDNRPYSTDTDIILGDSLGEMALWYEAADVVFMGGSLVETGGHNPLEASVFGVPVVSGPHIFNFEDIFSVLCSDELAWHCHDTEQLGARLTELLNRDTRQKQRFASKAEQTLQSRRGVTGKIIEECRILLLS